MLNFRKNHNFVLITLLTSILLVFSHTVYAVCPDDGSEPFTTGPVNPNNGFATFVQDSGSFLPGGPLALEICLDGDGVTGPCLFDAVDPANPYSVQVGFGAEAFWFLATATIDNPANNFSAELVQAVEAAWVAEVPGEGDQFPFTRLRIRLDVPAIGSYTVIHPYGQIIYEVSALVAGRDVNDPIDIPFAPNATNQSGRILPYLIWDPAAPPAAPAGYIGDPQVPHEVVGSPCGNNEFTVIPPADVDIGAGTGNPVTEILFTVQGKISTLFGVAVDRVTYSRGTGGGGKVNVFARSQIGQILEVTGIGNKVVTMVEDPAGFGRYFANISYGPATFPANITVTNAGDGLFVSQPPVDFVRMIRANYNTNAAGVFRIQAVSSDKIGPPTLEAFDEDGNTLGAFSSGTNFTVTPKPVIPPSSITVKSSAGGEAQLMVEIIGAAEVPPPLP